MDKKTFAQFLVFAAVVLIGWWAASYFLFRPAPGARRPARPAPRREEPAAEAPPDQAPPAPLPPAEAPPAPSPEGPAPPAAEPQPEPQRAEAANELIRTIWSTRGASLVRLEYLTDRYRAPYKLKGARPRLALLQEFQEGLYSDTLERVTFLDADQAGKLRELDVVADSLVYELIEAGERELAFEGTIRSGRGHALRVRKLVVMDPDSYSYSAQLELTNAGEVPCQFTGALRGPAGIERESSDPRYLGTRVGIYEGPGRYDVAKVNPRDILKKGPQVNESAEIAWAGLVNHYFVAITEPEDRSWVETVTSRAVTDSDILAAEGRWGAETLNPKVNRRELARQNATVALNVARQDLEPGGSVTLRYRMIGAPKDDEVLAAYDAGLPGLVEYGLLPTISRMALAVLSGVHAVVPNYGIAILVLTVFVRTLLHPLTRKSQLSMVKMQKLQPQLAELQRKYADDKEKLTQEQFALWKKYGANPLGGCWPMLLQMPILISLFGALRAAIELRHAGFLYISDLSRPDVLFRLPLYLPFLENEFNLLPILMGVVMYLNQKFMSQPSGSAQQQQQQMMLKFMPIFLTVVLYRMPSGLVLYFTTSTAIGALERWLIERKSAEIELTPVDKAAKKARRASRPATGPKQKGWLAQKMEKLQRKLEQQDRESRRADRGKRER